MKKSKEGVVKIDSELLEEIGRFVSRKEKRHKYSSKKQFVDLAILEKLERENRAELGETKREKSLELNSNKQIVFERRIPTGII